MTAIILTILFAWMAPLMLVPIEQVLPYPAIIEELVKLAIAWQIVQAPLSRQKIRIKKWHMVVLAGLAFTLTETVLYTLNIFAIGKIGDLPLRLGLTGLLHIGTLLLIFWTLKQDRKILTFLGVAIAMGIHSWFNLVVSLI